MEFFNNTKSVRLRSHLGKYLIAADDQESVLQNRNGSSRKARWTVELVEGKNHVIRLKSIHGLYLTASDEPYLLGVTGKKVIQSIPTCKKDKSSIEWEPIKEGYQVRLRAKGGNFLRANGATPPWRNSITHDIPYRTATQNWVLWDVDSVDVSLLGSSESLTSCDSPMFSSFSESPDYFTSSDSLFPSMTSESRSLSIVSNMSGHNSGRQNGMEFFHNAKSVRLQSHLNKYLVADDDEQTVRQSRNGSSHKARWTVEFIEGKNHIIRLKSCHGLYLTATDDLFLLGMTGKKVTQTLPSKKMDSSIEWEPIKEGLLVKLRTSGGKFLRANWGTPPWRNSVTNDVPKRTATQDWVLWGVDVVDISVSHNLESLSTFKSMESSSFTSSFRDEFLGSPDTGSQMVVSTSSGDASVRQSSGMEFFQKAKTIRLRSHHNKYLLAQDDQESVYQDRNSTTQNAKWNVEFVETINNSVIRLKSCYGKYLTATEDQFLLGVTGRKVLQTSPRKLDSSVEWEPIRDGFQVKLKTRYGNYLRANGGLPPWRNSITHDIPFRHQDWILWEVDVVELRKESPPPKVSRSESLDSDDVGSSSFYLTSPRFTQLESRDSFGGSPMKSEGRIIYYNVVDDNGDFDEAIEGPSFNFKGHNLDELTVKLEEETGLENIIVCSRNTLSGQLCPLRLALPPSNATMHIVVVPSTSKAARDFVPETPTST